MVGISDAPSHYLRICFSKAKPCDDRNDNSQPPIRGVPLQAFPTCSQPLKKVPDWNMKQLDWLFLSRNLEQLRRLEFNMIGIGLYWVISILGQSISTALSNHMSGETSSISVEHEHLSTITLQVAGKCLVWFEGGPPNVSLSHDTSTMWLLKAQILPFHSADRTIAVLQVTFRLKIILRGDNH